MKIINVSLLNRKNSNAKNILFHSFIIIIFKFIIIQIFLPSLMSLMKADVTLNEQFKMA